MMGQRRFAPKLYYQFLLDDLVPQDHLPAPDCCRRGLPPLCVPSAVRTTPIRDSRPSNLLPFCERRSRAEMTMPASRPAVAPRCESASNSVKRLTPSFVSTLSY